MRVHIPELKLFSHHENKFHDLISELTQEELDELQLAPNTQIQFTTDIVIPENSTEFRQVWDFQLYEDDEPTHHRVSVQVDPTFPDVSFKVLSLDSDKIRVSNEGDTVNFTVEWGHRRPVFMEVDVPTGTVGGITHSFLSSTGEVYISSSNVVGVFN
jgi:hypothetical protein